MDTYTEVIFDVETKKLFGDVERDDPALLEVSIVSLYSRKMASNYIESEGKIQSFWEKEIPKMWPIFQSADRIIGFNTLGFDVPALTPYANFPLKKLPHFDIMDKLKQVLGHRISLNAIAKETLTRTKIETGLEAVYLWQKGDEKSLARLKQYCEDDVMITKEVYDFGLKNGYLLFKDKWNTLRRAEIDFTYPKEVTDNKQSSLF